MSRRGLDRLRVSIDLLPVHIPVFARALQRPLLLPVLASRIPQMVVPYADAAAVMLANLDPGKATSRPSRRARAARRHAGAKVAVVGQSQSTQRTSKLPASFC